MRRGRATERRFVAAIAGLGAIAASIAFASPAPAADLVAMGDSYSSGTGTRDYFEADCERSNFAYGKLIVPQVAPSPKTNFMTACGGATTNSVLNSGQHGNPAQAADPSLTSGTDNVTISIGGNDAGFSSVLLECGQPGWISDCDGAIDGAQNTIQNVLPGRLNNVLDRLRTETSPATIVTLVGYPRIFNGEDCNAATFFSEGEMTRLNQMADLLADVMRTQARENGYSYADARGAFLGHAVCDSAEWLNGLSNPTSESFHPNKSGHSSGYQGIVRSAALSAAPPNFTRGPNGRIAFARDGAGGKDDVFVINGNGQFPVNLTPEAPTANDIDPVWSPDGSKLAFASDRDGDHEIYVLDFDAGGAAAKLTSNSAEDREPTWSPNGAYLAFRSARDGNNEIYKMTASGGSQTRLTANSDSEFAPDWSPDGAEIAYQRFGSQNDIWRMNSDGQGQTRLTTDGANDGQPAWSPSGHQIAFHSNRGAGDFEIYTMTPTGGSQTARTSNSAPADDQDPAWSPNGSQITFRSTRDGNSEIYTMTSTGGSQTRRTNASEHDATPSWQGDRTLPETEITSGPAEGSTTNLATPSFGLGSSEQGASFECQVNGGNYSACSSPFTTTGLEDGANTVRVRAVDPSGNVDPTSAVRNFTVDTTPADTAITAGPAPITKVNAPSFEFSSQEAVDHFECRIDSELEVDFAECASPFTASPLADGDHRFDVRSVDAVGNPSDPVFAEFTVDTAAPETSFVSVPADPTNLNQPSFEFSSSEEQSSFACRIDAGDWFECTSPFTAPDPLADGAHEFEVAATDAAGNADGTPGSTGFEVDTVAPGAAIDSGPPPLDPEADPPPATNDATPEFSFSSGDPSAGFECRIDSLDDADWVACEAPFTAAPLADGEHGFHVRAVDEAGNAGVPAERAFVVDVTDPETELAANPAELARLSPEFGPNFVFSSDDPFARFECRLYAPGPGGAPGPWTDCEPDQPLTDIFAAGELSEGQRRFDVRAVDSVANPDETPESRQFILDSTAPDLAINSGPAAGAEINDATPSFGFKSFDAHLDRYECRVDAADWEQCDLSFTAAPLADGEHTFAVRAIDLARNATDRTRDFTVDTAGPAVIIASGPGALTNDDTPTFAFSSEPGASLDCRVDSAAFTPCSPPHTTAALSDGPHTFEVRAADAAGNADTGQRQFTVDTTAPAAAITSGPAAGARITETTASFGFAAGGAAEFECRVDGFAEGAFAACASPYTTPELDNGPNTFLVRAIDAAGNVGAPVARSFNVDATRGGPGDDFTLGKLKRNTRRGTAKLAVTATSGGTLELRGKGLKRVSKPARPGSPVKLAVKPKAKLAGKLELKGKARVKVSVTFRSEAGSARTKAKKLKLVRR